MHELEKLLGKLNLNEAEKKIYIHLIKNNFSNTKQLTHLLGLPRTSVNLACKNLTDQNIIQVKMINNKKLFYIDNPKHLYNILNKQELILNKQKEILGKIVPELQQQKSFFQNNEKIIITEYSGEQGLVDIYNESLNLKKNEEVIRFSVDPEKFTKQRSELSEYGKKRRTKGIKTRYIIPGSIFNTAEKAKAKIKMRNIKILDKEKYNPDVQVQIWGNEIAFMVWDNGLHSIKIKNKKIADFMKQNFNLIWENVDEIET